MKKLTESTIIKYGIVIILAIFAFLLVCLLSHISIPRIALILADPINRWLLKNVI